MNQSKTKKFVKHIELLSQSSSNNIVKGFNETEKELMNKFIADALDLIEYNEWGVAIENLLENIYEINFVVDNNAIVLLKEAITECKMDDKIGILLKN